MNSYRYRVTVEEIAGAGGLPTESGKVFSFTTANHDDVLQLVQRMRTKDLGLSPELDVNEAAALTVGLKLFSEVVLRHRKDALFTEISEALGRFVRELKGKPTLSEGKGVVEAQRPV